MLADDRGMPLGKARDLILGLAEGLKSHIPAAIKTLLPELRTLADLDRKRFLTIKLRVPVEVFAPIEGGQTRVTDAALTYEISCSRKAVAPSLFRLDSAKVATWSFSDAAGGRRSITLVQALHKPNQVRVLLEPPPSRRSVRSRKR